MSLSKPDQLAINDESQYWTVHTATNGKTYYFNKKTQESVWEKPKCLQSKEEREIETDWQEYSTAEGKIFYYNTKLKKSVWKMPPELKELKEKQAKLQGKKYDRDDRDGYDESDRRKKEREEEERKQIAAKQFKEYMKEAGIKVSMRWDESQTILVKNEKKWNVIKQISEKKRLFQDFIQELRKKERKDKEDQINNQRDDYFKMLEESDLNSESKWHRSISQFIKDDRFRKIDERTREAYFQDYLDDLYTQEKEARKKSGKEQQRVIREKIKKSDKYSSDYTWDEFTSDFKLDETFRKMHLYDKITAFSDAINEIEKDELRKEKEQKQKQERLNRESFRNFLREKIRSDQLDHKTKYRQFAQENQNSQPFLSLIGQRGSSPHEFFQDEIITLKQYHADLKPEIKDYLKQTQYVILPQTSFMEFSKHVGEGIDAFQKLESDYKWYFYHLFMSKVSGKNKAKDALKKEKKLRKIRKRFFKLMRSIRGVTEKSIYEELEPQITKLANLNPKVQKIKVELREKLFEEYIQNHLKISSKVHQDHEEESDSDEEPPKRKQQSKYSDEEPEPRKKMRMEQERRRYSRSYSKEKRVQREQREQREFRESREQREQREFREQREQKERTHDEMEEEGEIQVEREKRRHKEKKSKKDKKRKRSRSRSHNY